MPSVMVLLFVRLVCRCEQGVSYILMQCAGPGRTPLSKIGAASVIRAIIAFIITFTASIINLMMQDRKYL